MSVLNNQSLQRKQSQKTCIATGFVLLLVLLLALSQLRLVSIKTCLN